MTTHILQKLETIRKKAEERKAATVSASQAPVIQLPLWPEVRRGLPNCSLRSALFGVFRRGKRRYLEHEEIAAIEGLRIYQTGPRLDQADLDVWEQCLHLARLQALGTKVLFQARAFLREIGRQGGGKDLEWLKRSLLRLTGTVIEVVTKEGKVYFGPLVQQGARDEQTGLYVVQINPALASLYVGGNWTQLDHAQRMALRGQPLAQWLHGFYATHAEPYPLKIETLHRLCGSDNVLRDFRRELREALAVVVSVTGWSWRIDENDLVHVEKAPAPTQARHLLRKRLKKRQKA